MADNPNFAHFSEQGFLKNSLKRTDEDLLKAKLANMQGAQFGGGDVLSQALASKLQGAYAGQLSDVKNRFGRENPVQAAQLDQIQNQIIGQNYANELRRQAEIRAADEAKKAKRKAKQKAVASLAATVAGAAIGMPYNMGTAGALIGGGAGGLIGGGS